LIHFYKRKMAEGLSFGYEKDGSALEKLITERDSLLQVVKKSKEKEEKVTKKYDDLASKLREQVECPVCLDVPMPGPVSVCPNGHLVCAQCKTRTKTCPTCRAKMQGGRSLLAETVVENLEHKCKYEGCEVMLDLKVHREHLQECLYRVVQCPSPHEHCGKEMPLTSMYDHLIRECQGSWNSRVNTIDDVFPIELVQATTFYLGCALCYKGVHFYVSVDRVPDAPNIQVFSVELFGTAAECKNYEVSIAVHRVDDEEMNGKHSQRFVGEPLPIDMKPEEKRKNGLMVGPVQMRNIVKDSCFNSTFKLTVNIEKKQ